MARAARAATESVVPLAGCGARGPAVASAGGSRLALASVIKKTIVRAAERRPVRKGGLLVSQTSPLPTAAAAAPPRGGRPAVSQGASPLRRRPTQQQLVRASPQQGGGIWQQEEQAPPQLQQSRSSRCVFIYFSSALPSCAEQTERHTLMSARAQVTGATICPGLVTVHRARPPSPHLLAPDNLCSSSRLVRLLLHIGSSVHRSSHRLHNEVLEHSTCKRERRACSMHQSHVCTNGLTLGASERVGGGDCAHPLMTARSR